VGYGASAEFAVACFIDVTISGGVNIEIIKK
jgi:hypothetical protein